MLSSCYLGFSVEPFSSLALKKYVLGDVMVFQSMEDNQAVSAWTSRWSSVDSLWCGRTEVFICLPTLGCFCQLWLTCKGLITELSRSVIFLKSSDTNAFTTQSPPRAPCASLLCECFLITNLTPQSKGSGPYSSLIYTHMAETTNALFLLQHWLTLSTLVAVLWLPVVLIPDSNYKSPFSLSI